MVSVTVKGAKELANALSDPDLLDRILRPGFDKAAVKVVSSAKADVHRVTQKLGGSIGSPRDGVAPYDMAGHGSSLSATIGIGPNRKQPANYTRSQTSRWKKPRDGTNTGDPQEYAFYEERRHPFLEPAVMDNLDAIERLIGEEADRVMSSLRRR